MSCSEKTREVTRVIPKAAAFFILSYIIGGVPTGYLLVKLVKRSDIRTQGSGNIGFTNVARTAGVFLGVVVLIVDAGKAFLTVRYFPTFFEQERAFKSIFGCAVIAGNILNPFLGFRGGKGVATGLGACLAVSPVAVYFALGAFGFALAVSRYISFSSLTAVALFAAVSARHASNIGRLIRGEESKIGKRR
jgi:glycerol-3-phosphate acyltransferase PlsY